MRKIILLISFFTFFLFFLPGKLVAQEVGTGIASYLPVSGDNVTSGQIVSFSQDGYAIASKAYDQGMYGVVSETSIIAFKPVQASFGRTVRVINLGKALVNVTTKNGEIKKGDLITSSDRPGIAQKATQYGYVLGTALENYQSQSPDEVGKIVVNLNVHPNLQASTLKTNLLEALKLGVAAPFLTPLISLRYLIAALVVLASFFLGFLFFGRSSSKGIEALGRNPLAAKVIAASMVFNLLLTMSVIIIGLGLSYLILTL
jgi:F0F1-type ATP synthase membrane subunit c/vacuolar-type H+-ATPase subunit K